MAAAIPVILAVGSTAMSMKAKQSASVKRQGALGIQLQQERAAEASRSINRLDRLHSIISSNVAAGGAHGVSPGSSTFKAINEKSFNKFDQDENADVMNLKARENYILASQTISEQEGLLGSFGSLANLGEDFFHQSGGGS